MRSDNTPHFSATITACNIDMTVLKKLYLNLLTILKIKLYRTQS
jgi:hypothetical protein